MVVPGRTLGEFIVGEQIGDGGEADVYLARQPTLAREAVVKVRRARDPDQAARFAREARLACQLDHPLAAHVYAFGAEPDGVLWIAMERVHGETLAAHLETRGRLALDELVPLFEALCEVVATAHSAGLVHRDIKPANVMVIERAGRRMPKLLDFGAASMIGDVAPHAPDAAPVDDREVTVTSDAGGAVGTPAYMAPEQWHAASYDHRVDIYALGVLAYRCLAGRLPFDDRSIATLVRAHAEVTPPPIGGVTTAVEAVIASALAKRPEDRPTSALQLARALRDAARPARRSRRTLAAATLVVAGLAGLAWWSWPRRATPWTPRLVSLPAFDENADRPRFSPDGRHIAFATDRERTGFYRIHVAGRDGSADRAITPPAHSASLLDWTAAGLTYVDLRTETSYLIDAAGGPPKKLARGARIASCGDAFIAHARSTSTCATCERLVLQRGSEERELAVFAPGAHVAAVRCDPAGRRLAFSHVVGAAAGYQPADLWILDVASGARTQLTFDRAFNEAPVFARGGESIVFSSMRRGHMNLWEIPRTGGTPTQLTTGAGNDYGPDLSPDGQLIYSIDSTVIPLFATEVDGRERRIVASRVRLQQLAVVDRRELVVATDFAAPTPQIVVVTLATGAVRVVATGTVAAPVGDELVIAEGAALRIMPIDGGPARPLPPMPGRIDRMRVDPAGTLHAMVDRAGVLEAWRLRLRDGGEPERDAPDDWHFVLPARDGRAVWFRYDRARHETTAVVVPAGALAPPADALRIEVAALTGGDLDEHGRLVYYDGVAVQRVDLRSGERVQLFESGEIGDTGLAAAADGSTIFTARMLGRTQRVVIENFADRP